MSKNEVLTPDIIEEIPLEQVIEKTLVKNNVTNKVISELKKKYGGMTLKAIDDKQSYLEIKEARNAVRKIGILAERCCKVGREDAIKIQKMWLAKEKEVLGKIDEVQLPLESEMKKYEDEEARLEQLKIQQQEEQFMLRQTTLLKMEAKYEGNFFSLGGVSYELQNIKEADEEIWNDTILPKFQREFAKVEAEKAELEKQKHEAEQKLRAEQEELKRQQDELNKQREEIRLQQETLQKQQAEAQRIENEKLQQQQLEEQKKRNQLQSNRLSQLLPFNPTGSDVDMATLWTLEEDKFNEVLETKKTEFAQKQEEEKVRLQEEAATKERQRIEAEQRQAELQRQQDEQRKLEEADKASDKDKWTGLIGTVNSIAIPEFKSGIYKGKLASFKSLIQQINEL